MPQTHQKRLKHKRKRKPVTATLTTVEHPKGRDAKAGHEERLPAFIKKSLDLKRKGLYLHEIAEAITKDFNLATVPHITTVANWIRQGNEAVKEDISHLQIQLRIDQFNDLERLKAKWMRIATADEIKIQRWVMVEGARQPVIDEDATKEQLEATNAIVKIMQRQARLLGLDLEKAIEEKGDGPKSLQDLQLWFIGHLNIHGVGGGQTLEAESEVLELKSGIPQLEDAV